jgi:hypothetical protein
MRAAGGVLPWAGVVVAFGALIGWLLARDATAGRWLFGAVLVAHGAVHLLFAVPAPSATGGPRWPFDLSRTWAVTGPAPTAVRLVGWALIVITVLGFALAGLCAIGLAVPAGWWVATVTVSAVASALTLVLFFDPQLVLGIGIDVVVFWVAASGSWAP